MPPAFSGSDRNLSSGRQSGGIQTRTTSTGSSWGGVGAAVHWAPIRGLRSYHNNRGRGGLVIVDVVVVPVVASWCVSKVTQLYVWVCVLEKEKALVYLLRWYSVPRRASMSLFPFLLCRLFATRWRSGTLLLRGIKHCIFRLWLTDLLQGLVFTSLWGLMGFSGEWCHAASPAFSGAVKPDLHQKYSALAQYVP